VAGHTCLFLRHNQSVERGAMRLFACRCVAALMIEPAGVRGSGGRQPGDAPPPAKSPPTTPPVSDEDKANQLSEQVGKTDGQVREPAYRTGPPFVGFLQTAARPGLTSILRTSAWSTRCWPTMNNGIALAAFDHKQESTGGVRSRGDAGAQAVQTRLAGVEYGLLAPGDDL